MTRFPHAVVDIWQLIQSVYVNSGRKRLFYDAIKATFVLGLPISPSVPPRRNSCIVTIWLMTIGHIELITSTSLSY